MNQKMTVKEFLKKFTILVFGDTDNSIVISTRLFLATIVCILLTVGLNRISFRYNLDLFKLSHYYGILAGMFLLFSLSDLLLIILFYFINRTLKVISFLLSIQFGMLLFLIVILILGFFRKHT